MQLRCSVFLGVVKEYSRESIGKGITKISRGWFLREFTINLVRRINGMIEILGA